METISAVIITLNEERNIGRCLDSLQGVVDEILVIDSGSVDKTRDICEEKGATFIAQEWLGYAAQKNYGNLLAKNNWILSLDADEALSPELQKSLLNLKKDSLSLDKVYSINRITNYCGKWIRHCGWYPDTKIRLFNRTVSQWNNAKIHEGIEYLQNCTIQNLKGDLLHYSYYNLHDHLKQINIFTDLTAKAAFEKREKVSGILSIVFHARWKFIRDYVFKLGFLDGYAGFLVCKYSAVATFTKYAKLKQLYNEQKEK